MNKVLIINGSVGVGKTSIADAISEIFRSKLIPHAVIDLDHLRYAFPRPESDPFHYSLMLKNLKEVWKNYHETGAKYLIIPSVIEDQSEIDDFRSVIPDAMITTAFLTAKLETIHQRLKDREEDNALQWHLDRASVLTKKLKKSQFEDLVVDTDNKSIQEIAKEILEKTDFINNHG